MLNSYIICLILQSCVNYKIFCHKDILLKTMFHGYNDMHLHCAEAES